MAKKNDQDNISLVTLVISNHFLAADAARFLICGG